MAAAVSVLAVIACGCVSLALLRHLWVKQPGSATKKILWSIIVCIPFAGWVFYGGFYNPPGDSPVKAKGGASGWKPWLR